MNEIFQTITTRQELQEFLQKLTQIEQQLFSRHAVAKELIESEFPYTISQALLVYANKEQIDLQDQKAFHDMVQAFTKEAHTLPYVSLTLSFMPSKPILESIAQWVHANISLHHLVDISVDSSLIGGSIVSYQGKYQDHSLRKLLDSYFHKIPTQNVPEHAN